MSTTLFPRPWPLAAGTGMAAWRFGQEVRLGEGDSAVPAIQWRLARNCSISPSQMLRAYLMLCALSLVIAIGFAWHGAGPVLLFAGVELAVVGVALLVFARHAADREVLTLVGRQLQIERNFGARTERSEFSVDWLRVEPVAAQGSLVEISGRGRKVRVGRFLRPELRSLFARELRQALRLVPPVHPVEDGTNPNMN